ncbi:glucuronate isomerase [Escherichia coli]
MTETFRHINLACLCRIHDYAKDQPNSHYHCHSLLQQIVKDYRLKTCNDIWLKGDHYKWRAMRTNGVAERPATGARYSDRENLTPGRRLSARRNPLYHWTTS